MQLLRLFFCSSATVLCALLGLIATALPQASWAAVPPSGSVSGTIVDQANQQAIAYATVSLHQASDSSVVSGAITDSTGAYHIEGVPYGTYLLKVEFLGFQSMWAPSLTLSRKMPAQDLGALALSPSAVSLDAVGVVAERNPIEYQLDKKVINVGADNAVPAGSAVDILQTAPSIQTTPSGDVSLRGSTNFRVLIDGKPSLLSSNDALRNIPSTSIDRIELITNPSAKYDADGTGGIINVILKKGQKTDGISGFAEASASRFDRYTANLMLSQRIGKVSWYVGLDYTDRPTPGSSTLERTTLLNDTTRYQLADAERNWLRQSTNVKTGIDFALSESTSISYSLQGGRQKNGKGTNSLDLQRVSAANDASEQYYLRNYSDENSGFAYSNSLNLSHQWNDKKSLAMEVLYGAWDGDHLIGFNEQLSDATRDPISEQSGLETTENNQRQNFQASADYTYKASDKIEIEAGLRSRWIKADTRYRVSNLDTDLDVQPDQQAQFERWIHAAYGTYTGQLKAWNYKLGLRAEYTDRSISTNNESVELDHLHWFPTAHLSRSVGKRQQVKASYSRRINRPREWNLFPLLTYIDPFNQQIGNPLLDPDFVDSYELGYTKGWGRNYLSIEGYHRITRNIVQGVRLLNPDNTILQSFANIDHRKATGLETSLNLSLHEKVNLTFSGNVFAVQFNGSLDESTALDQQTITWNTFGMLNITAPLETKLQLMGFYYAPSVGPQGETGGFWMATARVNKQVLNKKLNIGLEFANIFDSMRHAFSYSDASFDVFNEFIFQGQAYKITAAYTFNKFNSRKVKQRLNKDEMELEPTGF